MLVFISKIVLAGQSQILVNKLFVQLDTAFATHESALSHSDDAVQASRYVFFFTIKIKFLLLNYFSLWQSPEKDQDQMNQNHIQFIMNGICNDPVDLEPFREIVHILGNYSFIVPVQVFPFQPYPDAQTHLPFVQAVFLSKQLLVT